MGWLILIDILLIIVLALMLSVTVTVHLNDDTRIKVKYAGITVFSVSPEDEKHKKEKQRKKNLKKNNKVEKASEAVSVSNTKAEQTVTASDEKVDKEKTDKGSTEDKKVGKQDGLMSKLGLSGDIGETIEFAKQLVASAGRPVKRLINHIRVNAFTLYVCAGGDDAAEAALNYGKINWLVHTAIGFLYNIVRLDVKKVEITTDFTSEQTKYELSCKVKLRLGTALGCIIWLLFRLVKLYLKINIKPTNKRTAEANPDAGKA